jgi:3-hydroxyacyl-[acyl-carrier-protein] dehydratase
MSEYKPVTESEMEEFRDLLKRCPEGTMDALLTYRETNSPEALNTFLIGCIKRHAEDEYHDTLDSGGREVSFIDDLGIDSMTMMEIVMMVESCLDIQIDNQDLMSVRTLGDLDAYLKKTLN